MKKNYQLLKTMLIISSFLTQNTLKAQKNFSEYQTDVSSISNKQILLKRIDIRKDSLATNVNTNIYVSYRSGNPQKFWAGLAVATAGAVVSTQLSSNTTQVEGNATSNISPVIPLGVSVVALPSIWKNRPRGVPQAGLSILHRDSRGILLGSWEQPISKEAENSAELLTVNINKPLSEGTLEVYLQNGSKNDVYFWGLHTTTNFVTLQKEIILPKPDEQLVSSFSVVGCPNGYVSNGKGKCYNTVNNKSIREGTNENPIIIIRREIGAPLSDFSSKPDITGRKLLPPKPNPDPNPPTICIEWYLCYGGNCDYISTTCHGETIDGGGGGGGDNPFGGGDLGGGGFGDEDREEFKLGSLDWTAISKGWQIISNETGYVKRSQRNPTWKVYQDLSHSSLRLNGDFVGQISFSLIRTPHTNHSESNASIGLYINVVEQTPTWWGGTLNSADDYERFASWSANQIASH